MKITRATPVLFVDRVEPTRDFFKRVGFAVTVEVPAGGGVGFALLEKDGVQVMVETRDNENEAPAARNLMKQSQRAAVFVEVDDLNEVIAALAGAKVLVERHKTFYGADEQGYEEPGGSLVTFAQFA
jgi:glyoxalase/bleomycin resistance protein/dioxygenase superfamily protein